MTSEKLAFGFEWWFTGGSESPRKDCFAKSFFGPDGLKGSEERTVYVVLASLLPAALVRAHTAVFQHLLAFSLELQTSCFRASPLIENWEDKQPESFGSLHRINFRAPQLICLRLPVNMCMSASHGHALSLSAAGVHALSYSFAAFFLNVSSIATILTGGGVTV